MATQTELHDGPENFLVSERVNDELTAPEMVLDGLWPARTIGLFTGDGGVGKTHFTLQLLKLIASGGEIAGTPFRCATPRDVVYISQEDEGDFLIGEIRTQFPELREQEAIARRIRIISTAIQGPNLNFGSLARYLSESIREGCVFALDSLSTFLSCNENDNTELQAELGILRSLMKARQATCLLVHHRPKPNAMSRGYQATSRGGTAIPNSCRFHIMLEKSGSAVKLSFEKVSRGEKPEDRTLQFDEERKLFVPVELDLYMAVFGAAEELTTTEVLVRLGKDPNDETQRNNVLAALGYRRRAGRLIRVREGRRGEDAVWKRPAPTDSDAIAA